MGRGRGRVGTGLGGLSAEVGYGLVYSDVAAGTGRRDEKRGGMYYIKTCEEAWVEKREKGTEIGNHATTSLKIKKLDIIKKVIFILKLNRDQYCRGYAIHAKM
jgi:hypothetical protein